MSAWAGRLLFLAACLTAGTACTTIRGFVNEVPDRISAATKPVKYTLAATPMKQRVNLEQGQAQVRAGEFRTAVQSLHRALWDVEGIDKRWLRLEELAEAHRALSQAYLGLRKPDWAEEHRALAVALAELPRRDDPAASPRQALARAKSAYRTARFRDARVALGQALVELEGVAHTPARVASIEEVRCYLALSYFALDQQERAREEIRRLAALDDAVASCRREAPPAVRDLIREVQLSEATSVKRSIP
jgi:hypothetical protein